MSTITLKQNDIKRLVRESIVEMIKSDDENILDLIEDIRLAQMMENDKTDDDEDVSRDEIFSILDS